ncbi:MAG: hypothetical protein JW982_14295 [Spirochaetes bacterium]|nr:hypothetical protein [Spirochaetota bacterium]
MKINLNRDTTANVDADFFDKICEISGLYGISESRIFKDLIKLTVKNNCRIRVFGILTEYQNHSPLLWKKLNYSLNPEEIEDFTIIRQKYKISISKFAFIGFLLFLDLLIFIYKERLKKPFNQKILNSYFEIQKKYTKLSNEFRIRLDIIQKE